MDEKFPIVDVWLLEDPDAIPTARLDVFGGAVTSLGA